MLVGPIRRVVGTRSTAIAERRCRGRAKERTTGGAPDDPRGAVTNEDYAALLVEFERRRRHLRIVAGARRAGERDGVRGLRHLRRGRLSLERMNELRLYLASDELHTG